MYERMSSRLEFCIQVLHLKKLHYAVWSKMHKVTLFLINQTLDCRPVKYILSLYFSGQTATSNKLYP